MGGEWTTSPLLPANGHARKNGAAGPCRGLHPRAPGRGRSGSEASDEGREGRGVGVSAVLWSPPSPARNGCPSFLPPSIHPHPPGRVFAATGGGGGSRRLLLRRWRRHGEAGGRGARARGRPRKHTSADARRPPPSLPFFFTLFCLGAPSRPPPCGVAQRAPRPARPHWTPGVPPNPVPHSNLRPTARCPVLGRPNCRTG